MSYNDNEDGTTKGPWGDSPNGNNGSNGNSNGGGSRGGGGGLSKSLFPKGIPPLGNKLNMRFLSLAGLVALILWLLSGLYYVDTDEQGMVLRFGKWTRTTVPGLHVHWPWPVETVLSPKVTKINRMEVGYRGEDSKGFGVISRQVPEESLMLTGDENIVDINFALFWRIKDAGLYLFNIRDPGGTIKAAAESAMREVVGNNRIEFVLAEGRGEIEQKTRERAQSLLDQYGTGVEITELQLKRVDPPEQVIEAFRDVQRARTDQERLRNQADAYRNDLIPRARGDAEKILQEADAYKNEVIARADGDGNRFNTVLAAYRKGEAITTERIYIETLEEVMKNANKIIIGGDAAGQVVPYLPLPEVAKRHKATVDGSVGSPE